MVRQQTARAAGVTGSTVSDQETGAGSSPSAALHFSPKALVVRPIPIAVAREIFERHHYLHSLPGGTHFTFGAFYQERLSGAISFSCGSFNAHRPFEGATRDDVVTLTRLWLSDALGKNAESRVISVSLRALKRHTAFKAVVSYADPAQEHQGTIYQATNWLYLGPTDPTNLLDFGDGRLRHSRTVGSLLGTHSLEHLRGQGVEVSAVPQQGKHRYVYLLDPTWASRLRLDPRPYPKGGEPDER